MNKLIEFSEEEFDISIGEGIRFYRKALFLSQKDLAKRLGVSYQQYQKYETGRNKISLSKLVKICSFLKVSPDRFLAGVLSSFFEEDSERLAKDPFYSLESLRLLSSYYRYPSEAREKIADFLLIARDVKKEPLRETLL